MPESISLFRTPSQFKVVKDWFGVKVPWEVSSYAEDLHKGETVGGLFDLSSFVTIQLSGKDAVDYLQRMTTVDFKKLPKDRATYGAFLTGKGTVVSLGVFIKGDAKVSYLTTNPQREAALEHIEKFHFAEEFKTEDLSDAFALFGWWKPRKELLDELQYDLTAPTGQVAWRRWKSCDLEGWRDPARPELLFLKMERKVAEAFLSEMARVGVDLLGHRTFENLRIRSGVPEVGVDLSDRELLLETGFDISVHRNKGCYPGQEVIERIFTYGSVNKKLMPVQVVASDLEKISLPYELKEKDTKFGQLVSVTTHPQDPSKGWGLAYLQKGYWDQNQTFNIT